MTMELIFLSMGDDYTELMLVSSGFIYPIYFCFYNKLGLWQNYVYHKNHSILLVKILCLIKECFQEKNCIKKMTKLYAVRIL